MYSTETDTFYDFIVISASFTDGNDPDLDSNRLRKPNSVGGPHVRCIDIEYEASLPQLKVSTHDSYIIFTFLLYVAESILPSVMLLFFSTCFRDGFWPFSVSKYRVKMTAK